MKKVFSSALVIFLLVGMFRIGGVSALTGDTQGTIAELEIGSDEQVRLLPDGEARLTGTIIAITSTPIVAGETPTTTPTPTSTTGVFAAVMNGQSEVPSNTSTATGFVALHLIDGGQAKLVMQFSGLSSDEISAHIHGPAMSSTTAQPVITLPLGQLTDYQFPISAEQRVDLENGLWYVNVHSTNLPDGEIRGQLVVDTIGTISSPLIAAEEEIKANSTLIISAWGVNWRVDVSSSTRFTHTNGGSITANLLQPMDRVSITGTIATSSMVVPNNEFATVGPVIKADTVKDHSVDSRIITGAFVSGIEMTPSMASSTFLMRTTDQADVVVHVVSSTRATLGGRSINANDLSTTSSNANILVTVTGLYNQSVNAIVAKSITARVTSVPAVVTVPPIVTSTPTGGTESPTTTPATTDSTTTTPPSDISSTDTSSPTTTPVDTSPPTTTPVGTDSVTSTPSEETS